MASMHSLCITRANEDYIVNVDIGSGPVRQAKDHVIKALTAAKMKTLANKLEAGGEIDESLTAQKYTILCQELGALKR